MHNVPLTKTACGLPKEGTRCVGEEGRYEDGKKEKRKKEREEGRNKGRERGRQASRWAPYTFSLFPPLTKKKMSTTRLKPQSPIFMKQF